jgi:methionyl-tRNA formyltransferase
LQARHDVTLVLTQPDRPAGRGLKPRHSAVKRLAMDHGLALQQPVTLGEAGVRDAVAAARPDVMVVVAYGRIVPSALLQLPPRGCVNVHASLLPRWRGAAPIQYALLAGDAATGVTIMRMDEGLDTGPILLQGAIPIAAGDTTGTLHDKLAALGAQLLVEALATNPAPQAQDESRATSAPRITRQQTEIDWSRPAVELERQVRAFDPAPGAQTTLAGDVLKIWRAAVEYGEFGHPGTVVEAERENILIACGKDALRVTELQRAGAKRLAAQAFLAGCRLERGACLGSPGG